VRAGEESAECVSLVLEREVIEDGGGLRNEFGGLTGNRVG
jgi:hypothetical protein